MSTNYQFTADDVRGLLTELGYELQQRGVSGEIYLVGGAAIALAYDGRRTTRDLDAVFAPKSQIYDAAQLVATRHGLDPDWLNDAVKGMVPGRDPDERQTFEAPGISVSVPSPKHLLAMKVAAARVDRDIDDIRFLAGLCGYTSSQEVLDATTQVWGDAGAAQLAPKSKFLIEEVFGPSEQ